MRELLKFVPTLAIALFVVTTLGGQTASAGDENYAEYKRGLTAYQQGDYDGALAIWQPLADAGYPAAQFNIGMLYQNGVGVDQDLSTANAYFADAVDRNFRLPNSNWARPILKARVSIRISTGPST